MSQSPESEPVQVTTADGCCTITLNRPAKLNSLNAAAHRALGAALEQAAVAPHVRVIVITGAGRAFCAGQDLGEGVYNPAGPQPDLGATIETFYNPLIRRLATLPKPIIAAVNGLAAGAGANIAFACDIVVAARSASFVQAFAKIGLIPDSGGTWLLPRLVGQSRARALCLLAEPLKAEQAEAWGMIWKVVDDASLMPEVRALAARLSVAPTHALGLTKQALHAAAANTLDAQLDLERDLQREAGHAPDYAEGVAAFLDRRPPRFSGSAQ
jgi:2-(1,2-epoxy-1,2-dihydrophenyl)acetyl-CoA isomerase